MTEANWTQLIAMFGAVAIPGLVSCFLGWIAYKKSADNSTNINRLRQAVDGRFTELLSSTAGRSKLEGFLEGGEAEKAKSAIAIIAAKDRVGIADAKVVETAHALLLTAAETARQVLATAEKKAEK